MINIYKKIKFLICAIVPVTMALLLCSCNKTTIAKKSLIIYNNSLDKEIARYDVMPDTTFSISFIHSVNKSPVIDYYRFDENNDIYVYKTIYYNYGAGVETELENDETITYGDDGSMIIDNINKKISNLSYIVGTVSDHILKINDAPDISLRTLCGKNANITFYIK